MAKPCDDQPLRERVSAALIPVGCGVAAKLGKLKRPGATTTGLLILIFGAVQIMRAAEWPDARTWKSGAGLVAFVALAIAVAVLSFLVAWGYRGLLASRRREERLAKAANGIARVVMKHTKLKRDEVGVNIWRVRGPKGFRRLDRAAIAVEEDREETPILWTKGKGVIGYCWSKKAPRFADLEDLRSALPTEEEFCSIPREERFKFTWSEFQEVNRYAAVLAVPLKPRGFGRFAVKGVLAVDCSNVDRRSELDGLQGKPDFVTIKRTCEDILVGDRG
ncbi:MAG: hypothetical protein ABI948_00975 [Thermoleophilia bacterium]